MKKRVEERLKELFKRRSYNLLNEEDKKEVFRILESKRILRMSSDLSRCFENMSKEIYFYDKLSYKNIGLNSFSKTYQKFIVNLHLMNNCLGCVFSKIPRDVLSHVIIPHFAELEIFVIVNRSLEEMFKFEKKNNSSSSKTENKKLHYDCILKDIRWQESSFERKWRIINSIEVLKGAKWFKDVDHEKLSIKVDKHSLEITLGPRIEILIKDIFSCFILDGENVENVYGLKMAIKFLGMESYGCKGVDLGRFEDCIMAYCKHVSEESKFVTRDRGSLLNIIIFQQTQSCLSSTKLSERKFPKMWLLDCVISLFFHIRTSEKYYKEMMYSSLSSDHRRISYFLSFIDQLLTEIRKYGIVKNRLVWESRIKSVLSIANEIFEYETNGRYIKPSSANTHYLRKIQTSVMELFNPFTDSFYDNGGNPTTEKLKNRKTEYMEWVLEVLKPVEDYDFTKRHVMIPMFIETTIHLVENLQNVSAYFYLYIHYCSSSTTKAGKIHLEKNKKRFLDAFAVLFEHIFERHSFDKEEIQTFSTFILPAFILFVRDRYVTMEQSKKIILIFGRIFDGHYHSSFFHQASTDIKLELYQDFSKMLLLFINQDVVSQKCYIDPWLSLRASNYFKSISIYINFKNLRHLRISCEIMKQCRLINKFSGVSLEDFEMGLSLADCFISVIESFTSNNSNSQSVEKHIDGIRSSSQKIRDILDSKKNESPIFDLDDNSKLRNEILKHLYYPYLLTSSQEKWETPNIFITPFGNEIKELFPLLIDLLIEFGDVPAVTEFIEERIDFLGISEEHFNSVISKLSRMRFSNSENLTLELSFKLIQTLTLCKKCNFENGGEWKVEMTESLINTLDFKGFLPSNFSSTFITLFSSMSSSEKEKVLCPLLNFCYNWFGKYDESQQRNQSYLFEFLEYFFEQKFGEEIFSSCPPHVFLKLPIVLFEKLYDKSVFPGKDTSLQTSSYRFDRKFSLQEVILIIWRHMEKETLTGQREFYPSVCNCLISFIKNSPVPVLKLFLLGEEGNDGKRLEKVFGIIDWSMIMGYGANAFYGTLKEFGIYMVTRFCKVFPEHFLEYEGLIISRMKYPKYPRYECEGYETYKEHFTECLNLIISIYHNEGLLQNRLINCRPFVDLFWGVVKDYYHKTEKLQEKTIKKLESLGIKNVREICEKTMKRGKMY